MDMKKAEGISCADADGDIWEEEYPVCFVDWKKAHCYAKFWAKKQGFLGGYQRV